MIPLPRRSEILKSPRQQLLDIAGADSTLVLMSPELNDGLNVPLPFGARRQLACTHPQTLFDGRAGGNQYAKSISTHRT